MPPPSRPTPGPSTLDLWAKVDTLFDAALQRPADERTAWLRATCGDDPDLYRAVTALLSADAEAEAALGESATSFASDLLDVVQRDRDAVLPEGTRVGAYRILNELGRGGMGAVYRAARADGAFDKEVALKLVKRGQDTDEVLRRFRSERQILAGLEHPNIARLLDAGAAADGRPFVAMELVEGEPITAYAERRQLDRAARLALFEQAVEAVAYAHRRLVVHRDLKPSNILVADGDGGPEVKLLDFGIARLLDTADGLTRPEMRVLTPEYAAPEQRRGDPPTAALDVFALGVVLHELVTGARPDGAPDPSLRGDLGTLARTALHSDPARRYGSAEALADDLRRLRQTLPLRAQPDTVGYRTSRFVARHRAGVASVALALVAAVGGTVAYTARVTSERDAAQRARDRAEATATFVTDLFNAADPFDTSTERPDTLRARDLLLRGADRARTSLADQPATRADILATIGETLSDLSLYAEADSVIGDAVAAARTAGAADGLVRSLLAQGQARYLGEAPAEAIAPLREALDLAVTDVPDAEITARLHLGAALRRTGALDEAATVLDAVRTDDASDPLDIADLWVERGRVDQERGRPVDAEPFYRRALALQRTVLNDDHPQLATTLEMIGVTLRDQGRYAEAETPFREVYRIRQAALGDDHVYTATARYHLALIARDQGRTDEAAQTFREIIAWDREHLGDDHPYVGYNLLQLGITHGTAQQPDSAIAAYRDARAVFLRTLPDDHMAVLEAWTGEGYELTRSGRAREGEPILRRVLAVRRDNEGPESWRTGVAESTLGDCLLRQGRLAEAERHLVHGYETIRAASGPEEAALRRLVELYETTRQPDRAKPYRDRLAELEA